jgi:hypothetical protein
VIETLQSTSLNVKVQGEIEIDLNLPAVESDAQDWLELVL